MFNWITILVAWVDEQDVWSPVFGSTPGLQGFEQSTVTGVWAKATAQKQAKIAPTDKINIEKKCDDDDGVYFIFLNVVFMCVFENIKVERWWNINSQRVCNYKVLRSCWHVGNESKFVAMA